MSLALALGLDAGGSATRWALAGADGAIVAEGEAAGLSVNQMGSEDGRAAVRATLAELARQVLAHGRPLALCGGLTGLGGDNASSGSSNTGNGGNGGNGAQLSAWLAAGLALPPGRIVLRSDIEIAYLDCYAPGQGYLVYAGTGSIAAFIDADGQLHRAGGRGVALDDGGGGYWIAREALRHVWRLEDEHPGAWRQSAMARALFDRMGGSDWARSREFVYGAARGDMGKLALAVAASAHDDTAARAILEQAGRELARIALALVSRYGARPVALAGRAATLHPLIAASMRAALPPGLELREISVRAHHAAARLALHFGN
jgi:N-acetylglucosamine kinase-like BadF-type ATPase